MTELTYTAWDDKKYRWPPPNGWYQASDGKWWPEGYGPPVDAEASDPVAEHVDEEAAVDSSHEAVGAQADNHDAGDVGHVVGEQQAVVTEAVEASDGHAVGYVAGGQETVAADADGVTDLVGEVAEPVEEIVDHSELIPESGDDGGVAGNNWGHEPDLDLETVRVDVEAVEADPVPSAEGGNGAASVAGLDDAQADDVSTIAPPSGEGEPLPDTATEEPADSISAADFVAGSTWVSQSSAATEPLAGTESSYASGWHRPTESADPTFAPAPNGAVDAASAGLAGWAQSTTSEADELVAAGEGAGPDATTVEAAPDAAEAFESGVNEYVTEDQAGLTPGVEETTEVLGGSIDAAGLSSDPITEPIEAVDVEHDYAGLDPTETIDIDPTQVALDSEPQYGGPESATAVDQLASGAAAETAALDFDRRAPGPPEQPNIQAPSAGEHAGSGVDEFSSEQALHDGGAALTPVSSPIPATGSSRRLLFVILGILALLAAGLAGYFLFQLQSDDADATEVSTGLGSFATPHDISNGVRLTIPVSADTTHLWMLQVRSPATVSDVGDGQVEVAANMRVRNDTSDKGLVLSNLTFNLVSADGSTTVGQSDTCSSGGDLDRSSVLEPGKDFEGNVCWTTTPEVADGALLAIESLQASGRIHIRLS